MAPPEAEQAIRSYLRALRDPDSLVDQAHLQALHARVESSDDPVERLKIRGQIERDSRADGRLAELEQAFITHAKVWAEEHHVTPQAFETEGVSRDVLARAGWSGGRANRSAPLRRSRSARIPTADIYRAINSFKTSFTVRHVAELAGLHGTARVAAVLQEQMALDPPTVEVVGPDPDHRGPGRSPMLYRRLRDLPS